MRNKTPAERALELICTMADIPFEDFEDLLRKSQGDKATERQFPQSSYRMVKKNYLKGSGIDKKQWNDLYQHLKKPKSNFGKG
jgi:hypothetical protein